MNMFESKPAPNYRVEKWPEVYPPNPAMLRLLLEREGYTVYQWGDRSGSGRPNQKYSGDASHWVISGALEVNVERAGVFVLEAGDRDFLPAESYHVLRVVGDEPVIYLMGKR